MKPTTSPVWEKPSRALLAPGSTSDRMPGGNAKRVLIIEDDRDIVMGMTIRLRSRGYETLNACDGGRGVDSAVQNHPDAIVMDVRMPRMDGLQALSQLQSLVATRAIPVIMLSASLADRQSALDAGARFFIRKPYQNDILVAALESALNDSRERENGRSLNA